MLTNTPFDDVLAVINNHLPVNAGVSCSLKKHLLDRGLAADSGLGSVFSWLASTQQADIGQIDEAHVCVLASAYEGGGKSDDVQQFIAAAAKGDAPVNVLCVPHGVGMRVLEMAPEIPHVLSDWSELDCTKAIAFGMEAGAAGGHLLGLSDFAPGNIAGKLAIIAHCASGGRQWISAMLDENCDPILERANELLAPLVEGLEPLETLRALGGREVAGCLGAMIAAKSQNIAVVIDGWAALAAYAVLKKLNPDAVSHIKLASCESELHVEAARVLSLEPLVGELVDAGPGCGAALSVSILDAAVKVAGRELPG